MNFKGSQTFNDGLCRIYSVENTAPAGRMPVKGLVKKSTRRYAERTVGITRFTSFKQIDAKVDRVLRMPLDVGVSSQDVCIPNDGEQYEVLQVQYVREVRPPCMDLTLQRLEVRYGTPENH